MIGVRMTEPREPGAVAVARIVSGGQTGADQAGLGAAEALGLETGGWIPARFRTEAGACPDLGKRYGLKEYASPAYPPRTEANVLEADATLIFGDRQSPGCRLTYRLCAQHGKPVYFYSWTTRCPMASDAELRRFREWLARANVSVLNVAGNRQSSQPGIYGACRDFLVRALGKSSDHNGSAG